VILAPSRVSAPRGRPLRQTAVVSRGLTYTVAAAFLRPIVGGLTRPVRHGGEHLPRSGGVVVAANHLSFVDPLVLAHAVHDLGRRPRFLAKAELFGVPVVGGLLRGAGQIPVHRGTERAAHALDAAVAAVRRGECVVVYPEGTLTHDPALWPDRARTGAARIALTTRAPLLPVAQWGAQDILPPWTRRLRLLPRRTVTVSIGPPVHLQDLYGREQTSEVLAEATGRLMDAITDQLAVLRGEPRPDPRPDPHPGSRQ
jgi:1-acyl-sn-glycerol-3-phosphate acyltransferase